MRLAVFKILIAAQLFASGMTAHAAFRAIGDERLDIVVSKDLISGSEGEGRRELEKKWQTACAKLGESLTVGGGPWGMGFFKSVQCRLFDGEGGKDKDPAPWRLAVGIKDKEISFALTQGLVAGVAPVAVTIPITLSLRRKASLPVIMAGQEFRNLLAMTLLDVLPAAWRFDAAVATKNNAEVTLKVPVAHPGLPDPYGKIAFYQLWFDEEQKIWVPIVVGHGQLVDAGKIKRADASDDAEDEKAREKEQTEISYKPSFVMSKVNPTLPIFAHNSDGPRQIQQEIRDSFTSRSLALERATFGVFEKAALVMAEGVSGGFFGIRYGFPLDKEAPLVRKTNVIGLLVEMRGGPLKGLRFYYDYVPDITDVDETARHYKYGWNRSVLGWSLGTKIGFIDRVDLVPKIGIWNFKSDIETDPGVYSSFDINGGISLGLEVGIEKNMFKTALVRLWASSDINSSFISSGQDASVYSYRAGSDLFVDVLKLGKYFRLAVLGFGFYESVYLEKKDKTSVLPEIEFTQSYAGMGLSISW